MIAAVVALIATLAFVIVPGFASVEPSRRGRVARAAAARAACRADRGRAGAVRAAPEWKRVVVRSGETLGAIFASLGYPGSTMHEFLGASPDPTALTRLQARRRDRVPS